MIIFCQMEVSLMSFFCNFVAITHDFFRTFEEKLVWLRAGGKSPCRRAPTEITDQAEATQEARELSHVIRIDEGRIRPYLDDVVRNTAEQTLHAMLGGEANRPCRAERFKRTPQSGCFFPFYPSFSYCPPAAPWSSPLRTSPPAVLATAPGPTV
jgi:hypothetical protein